MEGKRRGEKERKRTLETPTIFKTLRNNDFVEKKMILVCAHAYLCTLNDELYSTSKFVYLVDLDQPYIL